MLLQFFATIIFVVGLVITIKGVKALNRHERFIRRAEPRRIHTTIARGLGIMSFGFLLTWF